MGSSLAMLKYLRRLDLSGNDFEGSSIPLFLGSFQRLTYLDLSYANFSGVVPHHLGNLSNLQVLNLSDIYRMESDGEWLSRLHKLQTLELGFSYLTGANNLLEVLNILPLLETLHLQFADDCDVNLLPPLHFNFTRLAELSITGMNFTNACWMSNLTNLEAIDLVFSNVQMDACRNDFTAKLCNLKSVSLLLDYDTGVTGDLNRFLTQCNKRLNLVSLTSHNYFGGHLPRWLGDYKSLQRLDLDSDKLRGYIPESIVGMTSLKFLGLSGNNLTGFIPQSIGGLRSLECLYLHSNSLMGSIPHSIDRLQSLEYLQVSRTNLSGPIPQSIGGLGSLKYLNLSSNNMVGSIPQSIGMLQSLEELDLSGNSLTGSIPQSIGMLQSLKFLKLCENNLMGFIPQSICMLQSLITLDLGENNLMGSIPKSIGDLQSLKYLDLSGNNLNGHLPLSLGVLKSLAKLNLSNNDFQGNLSEEHFLHLGSLTELDLSSNSLLQVTLSPQWVPPFSLVNLRLRSCKVGPAFPLWLRTQTKLWVLDMSNSSLSDALPQWIWNFSSSGLEFMYLFMNELKGVVPAATNSSKTMVHLFLDSNMLEGSLSSLPHVAFALSLSNNNFTGSIPPSFCELQWMDYLNLANNRLSGQLPSCSSNQMCSIGSLHLSNNNLHGTLPAWLGNCKYLQILDIGGNHFSGEIPNWISNGMLPLKVLVLKSNSFHGSISMELPDLEGLRVLHLTDNNLSGSIPPTVSNFSAMRISLLEDEGLHGSQSYYAESITVTFKGYDWSFQRNLQTLVSIDLSGNKLSGDIPDGIGRLDFLINLNQSRNHLSGCIPESLSNLSQLESLDLSYNNLCGRIPQTLSRLTYLSFFDASFNNLSGRIPSGELFDTFPNSSYMGNLNLCGKLLQVACQSHPSPAIDGHNMQNNQNDDHFVLWLSLSFVLGFIMGFWAFLGTLILKSKWRYAYFHFVDNQCGKCYPLVKICVEKCTRMLRRS